MASNKNGCIKIEKKKLKNMVQKGIFSQLPPAAKGIIAVAVTVTAGVGLYLIYRSLKKAKNEADAKAEVNAVKNELTELNKTPDKKQTLTPAQAKAMSNVLFGAMDGYGTNVVAISKQLFQLKNQADWLAVSDAYGVKTLSSGKLNPEPDFVGTLNAALSNELGVTDTTYTTALNKYFKQRGINVIL